jgi:hypothetical protein
MRAHILPPYMIDLIYRRCDEHSLPHNSFRRFARLTTDKILFPQFHSRIHLLVALSAIAWFLTGFALGFGSTAEDYSTFIGTKYFAMKDLDACYLAVVFFQASFCAVANVSKSHLFSRMWSGDSNRFQVSDAICFPSPVLFYFIFCCPWICKKKKSIELELPYSIV